MGEAREQAKWATQSRVRLVRRELGLGDTGARGSRAALSKPLCVLWYYSGTFGAPGRSPVPLANFESGPRHQGSLSVGQTS